MKFLIQLSSTSEFSDKRAAETYAYAALDRVGALGWRVSVDPIEHPKGEYFSEEQWRKDHAPKGSRTEPTG